MAQKLKTFLITIFTTVTLSLFLMPMVAAAASIGDGCAGNTADTCLQKNPIVKDLNTIVNFLSALVGVVVVGVIILGGIQFATAGDKAEAVSAAKTRIVNGVIALVAYLFIFAFLQWLIPGGLFR